ncbi:MAG: MBL fold metallo-hydrolase [Elusimicrobia bacterium]|nr:MBL fold metallo-hydrolase [Elusimicrobiota bacterium]
MENLLKGVTWFKQAGIRIKKGGTVIYLDPWNLEESDQADLIFITHEHFDHLSERDIHRLRGPAGTLVVPATVGHLVKKVSRLVKPGDAFEVRGVKVSVVPAYNPRKEYHPKHKEWVGYVLEVEGVRYYHAGDTDVIPDMQQIKTDVAFLPTGGTYTMDGKEARKAVEMIQPQLAIPIHWGDIVGSYQDAQDLVEPFPGRAQILTRGVEN